MGDAVLLFAQYASDLSRSLSQQTDGQPLLQQLDHTMAGLGFKRGDKGAYQLSDRQKLQERIEAASGGELTGDPAAHANRPELMLKLVGGTEG